MLWVFISLCVGFVAATRPCAESGEDGEGRGVPDPGFKSTECLQFGLLK